MNKMEPCREEYNRLFGLDLSEEEYQKVMSTRIEVQDKICSSVKANTLHLDIDGHDLIHVEVKNGIKFDGIVNKAEITGNQFRIEGKLAAT